MINSLKKRIKSILSLPEVGVFPSIDYELIEHKSVLKGKVLNAGAGWRDVSHLVDGEVINQDIAWPGDERKNINIYSPIHKIPVEDNYFDAILCIAVLEHVENPEEVVPELYRVLKPGGHLILDVPFLQPEHKVPTDFQRYTKDGLVKLASDHGFQVLQVKSLFTVYHTFYWLVLEWLSLKDNILYKFLRITLLPLILLAASHSKTQSDKLASVFQLVATKEKILPGLA